MARSPGEVPPCKRYCLRVVKAHKVSQTLELLRLCNAGFPEGKLHIRGHFEDDNGKNIVVGAEPPMVKFLEERKFRLCCGAASVEFWEKKGRKWVLPSGGNRSSTPVAARASTKGAKVPRSSARTATGFTPYKGSQMAKSGSRGGCPPRGVSPLRWVSPLRGVNPLRGVSPLRGRTRLSRDHPILPIPQPPQPLLIPILPPPQTFTLLSLYGARRKMPALPGRQLPW